MKAEEQVIRDSSPQVTTSALPNQPQISISIERPKESPPHRKRAMTGNFSETSAVSLRIPGLVSPSATAAVLPDMESPLSRSLSNGSPFQSFAAIRNGSIANGNGNGNGTANGLSAIPQSPGASTPGDHLRSDYFSAGAISRKTDPSPDRSTTTPGASSANGKESSTGTGTTSSQAMNMPQTPGGSFMGKFKGFGKKKQAEQVMAPVAEVAPEPVEDDVSAMISNSFYLMNRVQSRRRDKGSLQASWPSQAYTSGTKIHRARESAIDNPRHCPLACFPPSTGIRSPSYPLPVRNKSAHFGRGQRRRSVGRDLSLPSLFN